MGSPSNERVAVTGTALLAIGVCIAAWPEAGAADATEMGEQPTVIVVQGAPGAPEYEPEFARWADLWESAAARGGATVVRIGVGDSESDRDRLEEAIENAAAHETAPLWLVLIGHGTYDGREAKFNLRGPDISAADLAGWIAPLARPVAVLNCSSSSGPFVNRLSGKNRVVVTATRSGDELNYARFGQYLAEAIGNRAADLDKDEQVSLLEAYLWAGARTAEFYSSAARLATEHALLDDNGDGLGTPADWFRGVRATKRAKEGAASDGTRAHQWHLVPSDRERRLPPEVRRRRDELELQMASLRDRKAGMSEDEYYRQLQAVALELARLYRDAGVGVAPPRPAVEAPIPTGHRDSPSR